MQGDSQQKAFYTPFFFRSKALNAYSKALNGGSKPLNVHSKLLNGNFIGLLSFFLPK